MEVVMEVKRGVGGSERGLGVPPMSGKSLNLDKAIEPQISPINTDYKDVEELHTLTLRVNRGITGI
jgi:hypothetical protein